MDVNLELWGAIGASLTGLGGTVKWAVSRWEKAQSAVAFELFETRVLIAALLERERNRDTNRRRRESAEQQMKHQPRTRTPGGGVAQAVPVTFDEEQTDIHALMESKREELSAAKKARDSRPPRPGTYGGPGSHHDET